MSATKLQFTKMQGLGNDYVYVDCTKKKLENASEVAVKVSDRHFGIGSDGLILINASSVADFEMEMYNADGQTDAVSDGDSGDRKRRVGDRYADRSGRYRIPDDCCRNGKSTYGCICGRCGRAGDRADRSEI